MALIDGQVQVRDLVMGCGTPYEVVLFNPFSRRARVEASQGRAWNDGSWSGVEFLDETIVPWRVYIRPGPSGEWLDRQLDLMAAFEPIGDATTELELSFAMFGREFVMFGRPRMHEPEPSTFRPSRGRSWTEVAFAALDPRIYSADEQTVVLGLPEFSGGMTWPMTWPMTWDGVLVDGIATAVNSGKAQTPLLVRIDGPVKEPRFTVQHPNGDVDTLRFQLDLAAGQWLTIDTGSHAVLLNDSASRRRQTVGTFPRLRPGTSTIRFNAAEFNDDAEMTVRWRSAW